MSWRVVGLVVTAWVVALALLLPGGAPGSEPPAAPAPAEAPAATGPTVAERPPERAETGPALAALTAWDARRAEAWATGDAAALRDLYTDGSRAGRADADLLAQWGEAGWRVDRLTSQLLAVEVVRATRDRMVLRVVDRVAGGRIVATSDGTTRTLPSTAAATRTVELRRSDGDWQVAAVRLEGV